MKFEELDLNDNVLDALYDMNFEECTPVQENCIPEILKGRDLMGVAQTGTGKTAAYLLPILSMLDDGGFPKDAVNCVIMSPTRELAQQIDQAMQGFAYYLPEVSSVAVYGGNDGNRYDQEMKSMRMGADVIIATPGRLISHISMGNIDLSRVSFFVLDEADRMLDMGFSEDIMKIASQLPESCQTIMYSATMPKDIEKMAQKLLKNPVEIKLAVSKPAEKIQQSAYICYTTQKLKIIKDIFKQGNLNRVIVFSGSKMKVKQINAALNQMHINSGEMHSDLDQAQRDEVMFKFKSGEIDVLVATDIVARGIDIDDIAMVINYDVPRDTEDYVHRIGRTARADRDGVAITLVNEDDMYAFRQIEKFLEKDITKNPLPEECGEGPEYNTSSNPRKTPAKKRRQNDRDETSHKKTKQRNRRNSREQHDGHDAPRREQQAVAETQSPKPEAQEPKAQEAVAEQPQAAPATAEGEQPQEGRDGQKRRNNRRRGRGDRQERGEQQERGERQEHGERKERQERKERPARDNQGEQAQEGRDGQKRRNNRRRGRDQQEGEGQRDKRQNPNRKEGQRGKRQNPNRSERQQAPGRDPYLREESSIKTILTKPLKWLKGLGKK